ncbi:MAG: hypothetical protein NC822_03045 [Candidatus Omnitrophica bacterium]|nr:hypothetical protein [Candidatus Omnitrophota bacterium]MCM8827083.1 hypothetical protein [Candidatus Omnitrophota bacterium]
MRRGFFYSIIIFSLLTFLFSGCYNLRKKFVRKKKIEKEPTVYLNLKDYPSTPTKEIYTDCYLFFIGWLDEFIKSADKEDNYKREKKALDNAGENLAEIIEMFNEEGKQAIKPLYEDFLVLKEKVTPYKTSIDREVIIREAELIRKRFSKDFKYSKVSQWIIGN